MGGFLRPFGRVGGMVLLEVTGGFFFLFVILFANWTWKLRTQYAQGPDHSKFLVYAILTIAFLYLSVSSFWRARRK
jgi:H+/Cl- antiporter ClcA